MVRAFIAAGSNLGGRSENLQKARLLLNESRGITLLGASPVYETQPEGGPPQGAFLNAVWEIETSLPPLELLQALQAVETSLGRERTHERNGPRTIDLDLLFYGHEILEEEALTVPHPRLHERLFVLKPLSDLAPEWVHPKLKKSVRSLLEGILERNPQS